MIDLQKFCAADDDVRWYLHRPWKSESGRVMAANGHIAVLLEAGADNSGLEVGSKRISARILGWAESIPTSGFEPAQWDFAPDPKCEHCDGKPAEPDEDGDIAECYWCDGTGFDKKRPVKVGNAHFATHYLRLIAALPDCEICPRGPKDSTVFKFTGGIGFLMPIRDPA